MKRLVSGIMLTLLLTSMLTLAFKIQSAKAEGGTIYIRADGSIDPPTAPISTVDNVTYSLTSNITSDADGIVVERDNIVVDGAGYTVEGPAPGVGKGIALSRRSNVTIKNMEVRKFGSGIWLSESSNDTISENRVNLNGGGIELLKSTNSKIRGNNIVYNHYDVSLSSAYNNTVVGNNITTSAIYGIYLYNSSNNFIHQNNFIDNFHQVGGGYGSVNVWDSGYPSGGNHWSDYAGVDFCSGPYQNETGGDGMGDTPYVIDLDNQDNYPLMNPWPSGWKLDFTAPTNHPIVDFAVYSGSLYAAADNKLYVKDGSSWNVIDAPTFVTSLESFGDKLVVGGQGGLYCYDGTSFSLIFSVPTYIKVLGSYNNRLYAGTMLDNPPKLYYCNSSADNPSDWYIDTDFSEVLNFSGPFGSIDSFAAYGTSADDDWPSFHHDAQHTGSSESTAPSNNLTLWAFAFDPATQIASPAVKNGKVFIGTIGGGGTVYALDAYTGTAIWTSQVGGQAYTSPCVADGKVFVGYENEGQTVFWALDEASGAEIWNFTVQFPAASPQHIAPAFSDGKLFIGPVADEKTYALNATTGELLWNFAIGGGETKPQSNPAVSNGMLIVGSQASKVYALNATTGTHIWNFTTGAHVASSPAVSGGTVFVASTDGKLYALDQATGRHLWNATCVSDTSSPAVADGMVFIGFEAFDASTGELVWRNSLDSTSSSPAVADSKVLVCSDAGDIFALDRMTGEKLWSYETGTPKAKFTSPVVAYGNVYVGLGSALYSFGNPLIGKLYLTSGNCVYSYDGEIWRIIKSCDNARSFSDMEVYDGKLYLSTIDQGWRKPMHLGGSGFCGRVIEFDGENWTTILDHDYWIYSLEVYDNKLYVGTANKIYTYNGTDWETSFDAAEGAFYAISMTTYDGKVYVGMGNGYIFADPAPLKAEHETIVVPEFPSATILAIFMVLTMLAAALTRKKRTKRFC